MNAIKTIEIKWDLLGAEFALLTDSDQADFFKGFAFEMSKYKSAYSREMQFLTVSDKLSDREKEMLESVLTCLWFKEKVK